MKVLLNDGMHSKGIELFLAAGFEIDTQKRSPEELIAQAGDFDAICVRSATKITREIIEAGAKGKLKIIGRAGVGVGNIDLEAASEHGIVVKYAPHGNSRSTAELAFALIAANARNVIDAHNSLMNNRWQKKRFAGTEISGKTLGIVGCGRIGHILSELVSGFNMNVIGYDTQPGKVKVNFPNSKIKLVTMEELMSSADYISLHVATKAQVITKELIALAKETAVIVNTSRANNVDEMAICQALFDLKIGGYCTDVHANEPGENKPFESLFNTFGDSVGNVILTSHLGASTPEAQIATSMEMAEVVIGYLSQRDFTNAVNVKAKAEEEDIPLYNLVIFHKDKEGVFAQIDKILAAYGINIRENPSRQVGAKGKAIAIYGVQKEVSDEVIEKIETIPEVIWAKK